MLLGVYDRDEAAHFGPDNAKDVTPSVMQRLQDRQQRPQEAARAREGFDEDFVSRETEALTSAPVDETEQPEDQAPLPLSGSGSSEAGTEPSPAAADQSAGAADQEEGSDTGATGDEPSSDTSLSDLERKNLIEIGRMLVAAIGPKQEELLIVFDNCMSAVPNPSKLFVDKAKNVAKITRNACHDTADDKRLGKPDAVRKVALVIGCEVSEVLP